MASDPMAPRLDLLDPAVLADPYPLFHRLRAEDPVHHEPDLGFWALTRYADAVIVLREPALFSSEIHDGPRPGSPGLTTKGWFVFLDPPRHTRLRALAHAAFTPPVVERLRPRIQTIVDELLDGVAGADGFDLIAHVAFPLPAIVIAELLGVPAGDRERFKAWSRDLAAVGGLLRMATDAAERMAHARASGAALDAYVRDIVRERRRAPRDDLVSRLAHARAADGALSEDEIVDTCVLLLFAGHETTMNLIGNGMLALLRHPGALRRLREDPALIPSAVEELLRYDSPVQARVRVAREAVEIGGRRIAKGERVLVLLGAANRDPARFPEPDRLDVARPDNRHLAFGHGIHFCTGAPLARLEGAIAVRTLLARFPRLALAAGTLVWRATLTLRGLTALPVAVR
jgi:pimeloyl-[acyl-carrier protein] synthase